MSKNINLEQRNNAWAIFLYNIQKDFFLSIQNRIWKVCPSLEHNESRSFQHDWIFSGMKTSDDLLFLNIGFEHLDSGTEVYANCRILESGKFELLAIYPGRLRC